MPPMDHRILIPRSAISGSMNLLYRQRWASASGLETETVFEVRGNGQYSCTVFGDHQLLGHWKISGALLAIFELPISSTTIIHINCQCWEGN